jgi:hypothetical protein
VRTVKEIKFIGSSSDVTSCLQYRLIVTSQTTSEYDNYTNYTKLRPTRALIGIDIVNRTIDIQDMGVRVPIGNVSRYLPSYRCHLNSYFVFQNEKFSLSSYGNFVKLETLYMTL